MITRRTERGSATRTYLAPLLVLAAAVAASACGYTGRDAELIGQAKKVVHKTPIFCYNHYTLDVSLGVMKNGIGSMSTQDVWVMIPPDQVPAAEAAVQAGALVRVKYNTKRLALCFPEDRATSLEVVQ